MKPILTACLFSNCIGSILLTLFAFHTFSILIILFGFLLGILFSIPLLLVELSSWVYVRKHRPQKAFIHYSFAKYCAVLLTILALFGVQHFLRNEIPLCYGIPGLAIHFTWLRHQLKSQIVNRVMDDFYETDEDDL